MNYKNLTKNVLSQSAHWNINKKLNREIGIVPCLLLSDLISKFEYFENRNMLDKDGGFFNIKDNIEEDTGLSAHDQRKALKVLEDKNLIKVKRVGIPSKFHYYINFDNIINLLTD